MRRKQLRTGMPEQWRDSALHAKSSLATHDSISMTTPCVQDSSRTLLGASTSDQSMHPTKGSTGLPLKLNEPCATEFAGADRDAPAGFSHPELTKRKASGDLLHLLPLRSGVGGPSCSSNNHQELQNESGAQPDGSKLPHTAAAAAAGLGLLGSEPAPLGHGSPSGLPESASVAAEAYSTGEEAALQDRLRPLGSELGSQTFRGLTEHRHSQAGLEKYRQGSLDWHMGRSPKQHEHGSNTSNSEIEPPHFGMGTSEHSGEHLNGSKSLERHRRRSMEDSKALFMPVLRSDDASIPAQDLHVGEGQTQESAGLPQDVPTAVVGHVREWFSRLQPGKLDPRKQQRFS